MNHPTDLRSIRQDQGLIQSLEPKAFDRLPLILETPARAPLPSDLDGFLHVSPLNLLAFGPFVRDLFRSHQLLHPLGCRFDQIVWVG